MPQRSRAPSGLRLVSPKTIRRVVRLLVLAAIVIMVWLYLRGKEQYQIPEQDHSMLFYPGGTTVVVKNLKPDEPLERGTDVVYAMMLEQKEYARFGRVRALPGDVVGSSDGRITVNGRKIMPPLLGQPMGEVPAGKVLILAVNPAVNPAKTGYPDSRQLGYDP